MAEEAKPPAGGNWLDPAADRLRESAKWLVGAFGAVAAAAFAGVSLSNVGQLSTDTDDLRLVWALIGGLVALVGIAVALGAAMGLAAKSAVDSAELTAVSTDAALAAAKLAVAGDHAVRAFGGFDQFTERYEEAFTEWRTAVDAYHQTPSEQALARVNRTVRRVHDLRSIMQDLLAEASYVRLKAAFAESRQVIITAMVCAGAGIFLFAWAANPPPGADEEAPSAAVAPTPVVATLQVDEGERSEIGELLGDDCPLDVAALPVLVLEVAGDTGEVVVLPEDGCTPVRLTVDKELGRLIGAPVGD